MDTPCGKAQPISPLARVCTGAENHTLFAESLRKLLESEFESVIVVGNGRDLPDTVATSQPHAVLLGNCRI